jgi:CHAT domain-containing protein
MSLWKITDIVSQEYISLFYHSYLETRSPKSAFVNARTMIRDKFPEPFYWGALIFVE